MASNTAPTQSASPPVVAGSSTAEPEASETTPLLQNNGEAETSADTTNDGGEQGLPDGALQQTFSRLRKLTASSLIFASTNIALLIALKVYLNVYGSPTYSLDDGVGVNLFGVCAFDSGGSLMALRCLCQHCSTAIALGSSLRICRLFSR